MKNSNSTFKLKVKMLVSLSELKVWNRCSTIGRIQLGITVKEFYK